MKVNYKDFEKYRSNLLEYSYALTRTYKHRDMDIAKDAVQDTYLRFHSRLLKNIKYESEKHLFNELKVNLWQVHVTYVNEKYKLAKPRYFEKNYEYLHEGIISKYGYLCEYKIQLGDDIFTFLNSTQKKYILEMMKGKSDLEVSRIFNVSKQAVNSSIKNAVKKLQNFI